MFTTSSPCSDFDSAPDTDTPKADAKAGESAYSYNDLCLPLYPDMLRFASKLAGGNQARAEDVVQNAFLKAFLAWARWRPMPGMESQVQIAAKAWLYRIVAYTYLKDYRSANRTAKCAAALAIESSITAYYDLRDDVGTWYGDEVRDALAQLTDEHRDIIEAFYLCEFSVSEVGRVLGIPKGTVFSRLSRAHVALEALLGDFAAGEYGLRRSKPRVAQRALGRGEDVAKTAKRPLPLKRRVDGIVTVDHSKSLKSRQPSRG